MDLTIYRSEQLPNDKITWYFSSVPFVVYKRDDGWTARGLNSNESIALASYFRDYLKAQENVVIPWPGYLRYDYCGSYLQSSSGQPPEILERKFKRIRTPRGVANFSKLVREGRIVVNDYDSDLDVTIRAQAKNQILSKAPYSNTLTSPALMFNTQPDPRGNGKDVYVWNGILLTEFQFRTPYTRNTEKTTSNFGNYDIDQHISACVKGIDQFHVDGNIVVTALAKANQGQFDVLSNLAEMPETIMGILSGIREIFRMYKEARKGDFRLQNKISRLRLIANPTNKQRKELADALEASSSIWLTYRLAISPTVGMIEDALDLYFKGLSVFERYRETKPDSSLLDVSYLGDSSVTIPVTDRAFIKRKYDLLISKFGFPPLGAAWELVPLSFVLDRYVNIGELLTAFSPDLSVEQGATYSWKVSGSASGSYDLVTYQVTVSHYKRRVINPYHYCGLNFPPSRTFDQSLDHLALFWSIVMDDYVRPSKSRKY